MASGVTLLVWCCVVLFVVLRIISAEILSSHTQGGWAPAPQFARHTLVKPRIYHGREKRQIATTREQGGGHIHDLVVGYNVNGQDYVLDLQLNRDLIPKSYLEKHQQNGVHVVNKPTGKDVDMCYYRGQLRGIPDSWAAISTCHGISGVIFDGKELHYLERKSSDEDNTTFMEVSDSSLHVLYSHSDLVTNQTCGYSGTPHDITESKEFNRILRYKRDTEEVIHGPYNANKQSRYVELVLVVDNKGYKEREENLQKVHHHCKEIANIVNSLYVPLNIFVALVGVVVWTEFDEISIVASGDTTLTNFLHYRRERLVKDLPNDNAQLLTRVVFDGGVVGKALKGPICTYEFSGGVSMDHSSVVGLVATTVAHEMGHNFGMEHDTNECNCPNERCIMAPSSSSVTPTQWSSCSLEYLALAFEHGMDYCLRNKPTRLFDSPVCGNGFVEAGEQCDCGLKDLCDNPCCNATTCMLYSNASCATGECCDLKTCHPKAAGSMCRSADHECDLPEYCTGQSEYCPDDVFKMDGETCHRGMAFCYQGMCRTHSDQCQLLWGPSGKSSDKQCYEMNTKGSRNGNCGYNRVNQSYIKCSNPDIECGMLHCMHLNERLEFGMESVAILSHSFINAGGRVIPCRTAIVDLGLNQVDPGLAPDGSKCGDGKMCVNQKCMAVGDLRKGGVCPNNCAGNGVCNSLGHCHCNTGFAPPLCDYPGAGGSEDSGPASDPEGRRVVITALYAIFLGIVPFLALIAMLVFYVRGNVMYCWKKGSRPSKSGATVTDSSRSPPSRQGDKKSLQHRNSRAGSVAVCNGTSGSRKMEISGPLPSNSDNALTSLLPKHDGSGGATPAAVSVDNSKSNFQNNLIGHFKGFSITSIPSSSQATVASKLPSPPSKMANAVSPPTVPSGTMKPPRPPSILSKTHSTNVSRNASTVGSIVSSATSSVSVDPPTVTFAPLPRPVISSPILDTTTCTAKELTNSVRPVPSRPAPLVPPNSSGSAQKPARPLSSPNSLSVNPIVDEKKSKDGGQNYPTLTRLASFMLRQNSDGDKHKDKVKGKQGDGTNSLPRKANKLQIDREALRNLKISNPIPQQEIDVPETAVPVKPEADNKQVIMRAQSLRDTSHVGQRPAIPTFGSMRQPSGTKRPTSIPTGMRPSSPPPPRPPLQSGTVDTGIIGLPGYQNPPAVSSPTDYGYDDCFNLLTGVNAPLANIDEESSSPTNASGNIYAVIEESPPECGRKNVLRDEVQSRCSPSLPLKTSAGPSGSKSQYASPMLGDYKTPKPLDNSTSAGSIESMGLLSEIVNEIQARNFESIYSASGDKKTKSDDEDGNSSVVATDRSTAGSSSPPLYGYKSGNDASSISSVGTYINAPYSTSNIYGGGSSVYSNVSMQNNPANSPPPNAKSSFSSSSSSSGYLSPTPPHSSTSNTAQPNSATKTNLSRTDNSLTANSNKSMKDDKSPVSANLPQNLSSYKPYTSSFHRPLGPLAAASFKSAASSTPSDGTVSSQSSAKPKITLGGPSQANVPLVNIEERKSQAVLLPVKTAVPVPNKSSLHHPAPASTPPGPLKTAGVVSKPAPSPPVGGNKVGRAETKLSNSPDVVSSCSPATSGDAGRSPDIIGGKAGLKIAPKSPDAALKPQANAPAAGLGRSTSSVTATASKFGASSVTGKPATVHSSFRSKQPQTAPKPNISKPSVTGDKTRAPSSAAKGKVVPGVAKSVSDVGANRTMPAGARVAASKLSHVASLQQKFETVSNSSDKTVPTTGRTVSGVSAKTKAPSVAGKTGAMKK